jgi:hypothetical protein
MDNWAPRILVCRSARIGEGKRLGEHVVVQMSAPRSISIAVRSNLFEPV